LNVFLKIHLLLNCGKNKLKIQYSNKLHIKNYFIYITTLYVIQPIIDGRNISLHIFPFFIYIKLTFVDVNMVNFDKKNKLGMFLQQWTKLKG
jgi:hypothetical protein